MGRLRDLKKATEAYWGGKLSRDDLLQEGKRLRQEHWKIQKDAGVDVIPSNDFAFYDQVLDHIQLFGVCLLASCDMSLPMALTMFSLNRSSLRDTASTTFTLLTNTLPWVVVSRSPPRMARKPLMSPVWYDCSYCPGKRFSKCGC